MTDDEVVHVVLDAIARRDWEVVTALVHPYAHWDTGSEMVRGRRNVLGLLVGSARPGGARSVVAPGSWELRDGQIYRWTVSAPLGADRHGC
jgi:hypothetical protein